MGSESVNAYSLKFTRYRAIVIVRLLSQVQLFVAPLLQHDRLPCLSLFPGVCSNSYQLSWWCHPIISSSVVLLLLPPSTFSQHQSPFQWVCSSHQVAKYWSFNFSICPSKEYWGLISCRINWFDLLATWETLKSLLQHHSLKASVLWCSDLFMNQLSHPYMTTGKTIALTTWTFVGKVISAFHYTV